MKKRWVLTKYFAYRPISRLFSFIYLVGQNLGLSSCALKWFALDIKHVITQKQLLPEYLLTHISARWSLEQLTLQTTIFSRMKYCSTMSKSLTGVFVCSAASSERRQEPVWGSCGGSGGTERLSGVGKRVQWELGNHGGHGRVQAARIRLC